MKRKNEESRLFGRDLPTAAVARLMEMSAVRVMTAITAMTAMTAIAALSACGGPPSDDFRAMVSEAKRSGGDGNEQGLTGAARAAGAADEVLARVNGVPLTRAELDNAVDGMLGAQLRKLPAEQRGAVRARFESQVLEGMIDRTLLIAAASEAGQHVPSEEVAAAIGEIESGLPQDRTLSDVLAEAGLTRSEIEDEIEEGLRVQHWLDEKASEVPPPSDPEVLAAYEASGDRYIVPETVQVRHVLIRVEANEEEAERFIKKQRAEKIRQEILDGADFAEVAAKKSECPSREQGGLLAPFSRGELIPAFENAAFEQAVGTVGDVVESDFGYHIIAVESREDRRNLPLLEVEESIKAELTSERKREAIDEIVESLREKAAIVYVDSLEAETGAAGPA